MLSADKNFIPEETDTLHPNDTAMPHAHEALAEAEVALHSLARFSLKFLTRRPGATSFSAEAATVNPSRDFLLWVGPKT